MNFAGLLCHPPKHLKGYAQIGNYFFGCQKNETPGFNLGFFIGSSSGLCGCCLIASGQCFGNFRQALRFFVCGIGQHRKYFG